MPTAGYAVPELPGVWVGPGGARENTHILYITVPGEFQLSNYDGIGAFLRHDVPLVREQIKDWIGEGRFDEECGGHWTAQVLPEQYQPELHFATFNYNLFEPLNDLSDNFCSFVNAQLENISGSREVRLLSYGYGSSIVANAFYLGCLPDSAEVEFWSVAANSWFWPYSRTLRNYSPPPDASYAFKKFDIYELSRVNSPLNTLLKGYMQGQAFQEHLHVWFTEITPGGPDLNPELRESYPFKYRIDGTLESDGLEFRYLFALWFAGATVPYGFTATSCEGCLLELFPPDHQTFSSFKSWINSHPELGGPNGAVQEGLSYYTGHGLGSTSSGTSTCGNGKKEGAEQCDPPDGSTCSDQCTKIKCGDGKVEGKEECEPPGTKTCDSKCKIIPQCGNNKKEKGEQCDGSDSTACQSLPPPPGKRMTGACSDCSCVTEEVPQDPQPQTVQTNDSHTPGGDPTGSGTPHGFSPADSNPGGLP